MVVKIKEVRELKKISQKELSKKIKTSVRTLQRYETGERLPDIKTAQEIAYSLDTDISTLYPTDSEKGYKKKPDRNQV